MTEPDGTPQLSDDPDTNFTEQTAAIHTVEVGRGWQGFLTDEGAADIHQTNGKVTCVDEGTPDGTVRNAGSGLYYVAIFLDSKGENLPEKEVLNKAIDTIVEELKPEVKTGKVNCITSHEGCGAAGLVWNLLSGEFKEQMGWRNPTDLAVWFSKQVAEKLNVKYEHIGLTGRPEHLHIALATLVDFTAEGMSPDKISGTPPKMFVVSGRLNQARCIRQIVLTAKIATGGHGYGKDGGNRITEAEPFRVVVAAKAGTDNNAFLQNLRGGLAEFGKRVKIVECYL